MPYYKLWGDFLVNVEAENETEAREKVEEALDEIMAVSDGYARTGIDGATLEHME